MFIVTLTFDGNYHVVIGIASTLDKANAMVDAAKQHYAVPFTSSIRGEYLLDSLYNV